MGFRQGILNIGQVKLNEPLCRHTTFKIGGNAKVWVIADTVFDLKFILKFIKNNNLKFFIVGAGSNLLAADDGFDGVIISLGRDFKEIAVCGSRIFCGAAASLNELISYVSDNRLSGIEHLIGIPGLVGGALAMNAGVKNISICDFISEVFLLDYEGKISKMYRKDIKTSYRFSNLSNYIILGAWFKLTKKSSKFIARNIKIALGLRRASQDLASPSAGCIFKNPRGKFAGRLIELCGLKGKNIGDAFISDKHANFIINKGSAKAIDVLRLMDIVKASVKKKFNICLKPEIRILD